MYSTFRAVSLIVLIFKMCVKFLRIQIYKPTSLAQEEGTTDILSSFLSAKWQGDGSTDLERSSHVSL